MKTAWYVDDDEEMIKAISLMMKLLGYEVRAFINAPSAAKELQKGEQPDIILLDINMPQVSGIDMLEYVRKRKDTQELPVVMLTTEVADVKVDEAYDLGADAYVFKPVTLDDLEAAIGVAESKRKKKEGGE